DVVRVYQRAIFFVKAVFALPLTSGRKVHCGQPPDTPVLLFPIATATPATCVACALLSSSPLGVTVVLPQPGTGVALHGLKLKPFALRLPARSSCAVSKPKSSWMAISVAGAPCVKSQANVARESAVAVPPLAPVVRRCQRVPNIGSFGIVSKFSTTL